MQLRKGIVNANKVSKFSLLVIEGIDPINNESKFNSVLLAMSKKF